jgi:hypothetical protein
VDSGSSSSLGSVDSYLLPSHCNNFCYSRCSPTSTGESSYSLLHAEHGCICWQHKQLRLPCFFVLFIPSPRPVVSDD